MRTNDNNPSGVEIAGAVAAGWANIGAAMVGAPLILLAVAGVANKVGWTGSTEFDPHMAISRAIDTNDRLADLHQAHQGAIVTGPHDPAHYRPSTERGACDFALRWIHDRSLTRTPITYTQHDHLDAMLQACPVGYYPSRAAVMGR